MSDRLSNPATFGLKARLQFLARDSFVYGSAAAFNKAFGILTFPILARHLSTENFGLLDFFNLLTASLATLVIFGQDTAVARFFHDEPDSEGKKQCVSLSFAVQCLAVILMGPVLYLISDWYAADYGVGTVESGLLALVVLQIPALVLLNFSQNILKWTFASKKFVLISTGSNFVAFAAIYLGIIWWKVEILGIFAILLVIRVGFSLAGLWLVREWLTVPRDRTLLRKMLTFAAPMGLVCVIGASIPTVERALTVGFLGQLNLGLLAAGSKIALIVSLPIHAFQIAWGPFSLSVARDLNAVVTYNWVLKSFAILVLSSVVLLTASGEFVIEQFASERYSKGSVVIFPIALGLAIQGIGWITSIGIGISKKSELALYAYILYGLVSVASTYVLVQKFGIVGAAWGGPIAIAFRTVLEYSFSQRVCRYEWRVRGVFGLCSLVTAWGIVPMHAWPCGAAGSCLIGVGAVTAGGWFLFDRNERDQISRLLGRALRLR